MMPDSGPTEDDQLRDLLLRVEEIGIVPADAEQELSDQSKAKLAKLQRTLQVLRRASAQNSELCTPADAELSCAMPSGNSFGTPFSSRYRLVRRLGEGGFGIVFLGHDAQLNRDVAIKLPRPEIFLTKSMVERFSREAQNVAKLAHPNIVPVLATDDSSEMPAIVYHFCDGPTLAQWLRGTSSDVGVLTVARIGLLLAEAVQHAHSRGILHRDLKPSNILLEPSTDQHALHGFQEGKTCWVPRIIDFGISKATQTDGCDTVTVAVLGTPPYMSPEQLAGRTKEVGTHSDVYSLGMILYELLTKRRPYTATSAVELLVQIQSTGVPSIRRFRPGCSQDLDAIVLRCLQVDERDRYPTAAELAADLRRFLDGKPVSVRPQSHVGRLRKWAVRQPVVASLVAVCVLLFFFGLGATYEYVRRSNVLIGLLRAAQQEANNAVHDLRQQLFAADVSAASDAFDDGDIIRYHDLLAAHTGLTGAEDLRDTAWNYLWRKGHRQHVATSLSDSALYSARFSNNGRFLATCGADGRVRLIDVSTQQVFRDWNAGQSELNCATFSGDDCYLATAGDDGTVAIWDTATQHLVNRFTAHADHAFQAVFAPGDRLITCGNEPTIRVWNWRTGDEVKSLEKHTKSVQSIAVSADGQRLFSGSDDGTRCVWHLASLECEFRSEPSRARCVDIQPCSTGPWIFSAGVGGVVLRDTLDTASGSTEKIASMHDNAEAIAISPDGRRLAIATRVGVIRVMYLDNTGLLDRVQEDARFNAWLAHDGRIYDLAFASDGKSLHSVGEDGTWRIWSLVTEPSSALFDVRNLFPPSFQFEVAVAQLDDNACVFTADTGMFTWNSVSNRTHRVAGFDKCVSRITASESGGLVFTGHFGGSVRAWRVAEQCAEELWTYAWPPQPEPISGLAYSHSRNEIAVAVEGSKEVRILNAATGKELKRLALPEGVGGDNDGNMVFSRNGKWLAAAWDHTVVVWGLETGAVTQLNGHTNMVSALCFHPDSQLLLSGADDRMIRLWDVPKGMCTAVLGHHTDQITSLLASTDGRTIISTDGSGCTGVWHVAAKKLLFDLDSKESEVKLSCNWIGRRLFRTRNGLVIQADTIGARAGTDN